MSMEKGFVMIPKQITRDPTLSNGAYRVYGVLRSFADGNATNCFPARETIAKNMGYSLTSVKMFLKELKNRGYVNWNTGCKGKSNKYFFPLDMGSRATPFRASDSPKTGPYTDHHQDLHTNNYDKEQKEKLTYGKDYCFITNDGKIYLYNPETKERKLYSFGDDEPFRFGKLCGTEARKAAEKIWIKLPNSY